MRQGNTGPLHRPLNTATVVIVCSKQLMEVILSDHTKRKAGMAVASVNLFKQVALKETKNLIWMMRGEKRKLGREERYRTVISGMEPRRIAVVMLLPLTGSETSLPGNDEPSYVMAH